MLLEILEEDNLSSKLCCVLGESETWFMTLFWKCSIWAKSIDNQTSTLEYFHFCLVLRILTAIFIPIFGILPFQTANRIHSTWLFYCRKLFSFRPINTAEIEGSSPNSKHIYRDLHLQNSYRLNRKTIDLRSRSLLHIL